MEAAPWRVLLQAACGVNVGEAQVTNAKDICP